MPAVPDDQTKRDGDASTPPAVSAARHTYQPTMHLAAPSRAALQDLAQHAGEAVIV